VQNVHKTGHWLFPRTFFDETSTVSLTAEKEKREKGSSLLLAHV